MRGEDEQEVNLQEIIRDLEDLKITQSRSNQLIERLEQKITRLAHNNNGPRRVTDNVGIITGAGKLYVTVKLIEELSMNR